MLMFSILARITHSPVRRCSFPQEKLHTVDTSQDALVLLRTIGNQKLPSVSFRDLRPYMMAEDINFELTDEQVSGHLTLTFLKFIIYFYFLF